MKVFKFSVKPLLRTRIYIQSLDWRPQLLKWEEDRQNNHTILQKMVHFRHLLASYMHPVRYQCVWKYYFIKIICIISLKSYSPLNYVWGCEIG